MIGFVITINLSQLKIAQLKDFSKNKNLNVHTYCENLKEIYIEVVLGQAKEILPM